MPRRKAPSASGFPAPAPTCATGNAAAAGAGTRQPASGCGSPRKRATSAASSASVGATAKAGWVTSTTGSSISSFDACLPDRPRCRGRNETPGFLFFSRSDAHLESIHTNARGVCRSAYNDRAMRTGRWLSSRSWCVAAVAAAARRGARPVRWAPAWPGRSIRAAPRPSGAAPDGARQGPETRYYESGAELASGGYVDGAQSGVWRYRFNDGRNWRAERWEDGALIQLTVDPSVARLSPGRAGGARPDQLRHHQARLARSDPRAGDARGAPGDRRDVRGAVPQRAPRLAGSYDAAGLRTGVWRFWFEDGRPWPRITRRTAPVPVPAHEDSSANSAELSATPSASRTVGTGTISTGRLKSATMRRTIATCCASLWPKYTPIRLNSR